MTPLLRGTVTYTFEYEPQPEWYDDGVTLEQMAAYDRESLESGSLSALDFNDIVHKVTVEVVQDGR